MPGHKNATCFFYVKLWGWTLYSRKFQTVIFTHDERCFPEPAYMHIAKYMIGVMTHGLNKKSGLVTWRDVSFWEIWQTYFLIGKYLHAFYTQATQMGCILLSKLCAYFVTKRRNKFVRYILSSACIWFSQFSQLSLCNMWRYVISANLIPLWWLWEYVYFTLLSPSSNHK